MFETYLAELVVVETMILNEFYLEDASSYVDADFEVQILKNQIALRNNRITMNEHVLLNEYVAKLQELWKKLNNVK